MRQMLESKHDAEALCHLLTEWSEDFVKTALAASLDIGERLKLSGIVARARTEAADRRITIDCKRVL